MTRKEAIEEVFGIDYWGARSPGAARATAERIIDRLIAEGALVLTDGDEQ